MSSGLQWQTPDQASRVSNAAPGEECRYVQENAAAFALFALDLDETARVDAHLLTCRACADMVDQLRRTVSLLPFVSHPVTPPARAKVALFERIASTPASRATLPLDTTGRTLTIPASASLIDAVPPATPAVQTPKRRSSRWENLAAPLAAVPLVLALAIVGGWALRTQSQLSDRTAEVANLQVANADLFGQVATVTSVLPTVDSGGTRYSLDTVADTGTETGASGYLVAYPDTPLVTVVLQGLTMATRYRVVAESTNGHRQQLGNIDVNEGGNGSQNLQLDVPLSSVRVIHIAPIQGTTATDSLVIGDVLRADMAGDVGTDDGTEANLRAQ